MAKLISKITSEEYAELVELKARVDVLTDRIYKDRYVSADDVLGILGYMSLESYEGSIGVLGRMENAIKNLEESIGNAGKVDAESEEA